MDAPILASPDTSGLRAKRGPWGKLSPEGSFHPLADHCIDVAVTFKALLERSSLAARHPVQQDRLAVLAFLHDLGKCNRGFQAKADSAARDTAGHVMEALALLLDLHECRSPSWTGLLEDLCGWFASEEQAVQMLVASISHHGRPVSLDGDFARWKAEPANRNQRRHWAPDAAYDPVAALDELARTARQTFPAAFRADAAPIDACPALQHRFAGLVMLADWIGSDTQFFRFRQGSDEDRLDFARKAAHRALQAIGLRPPEPRSPRPVEEVFPFRLTPLQAALARDIGISEDTRLVLVESDTGSGKTEAALAWFFRLYANQEVDGLYFALPTRVAARELYDRVLHAVESAFEPEGRPGPVLLAVPGYVKVDGSFAQAVLPDPQGNLWDDRARDVQRERLWSAERPKRFLAAPVAVGTIDQALLSVLQVKHSLLRSVCLDRHLLVVDEVHASDPYMREALRALLRGHLERGGWAMLLSATLGESAASLYFDREATSLEEAIDRPYPLVTVRSATWPMPSGRERRIHLDVAPTIADDESLSVPLIGALRAGARVLVVCNTVARTNALFRRMESALKDSAPDLLPTLFGIEGVHCPHHGRFCREDRELLDATVTTQMGKRTAGHWHADIGAESRYRR
jgi:CRISPR-associated endonuclease/helicase Cas3